MLPCNHKKSIVPGRASRHPISCRRPCLLVWGTFLFALSASCSTAPSLESAQAPCSSGGCASADDGSAVELQDPGAASSPVGPPTQMLDAGPIRGNTSNPLCGIGCDPDNSQACVDPQDSATDPAAEGKGSRDAGLAADGAANGGSASGTMGGSFGPADNADKQAPPMTVESDGVHGGPSDGGLGRSCQVSRVASALVAACVPAGRNKVGEGCKGPSDCEAGLACVGSDSFGTCRPHCCNDAEGCSKGTYCDTRVSVGTAGNLALPVCVPAERCELLRADSCQNGLVCGIVRSDGTTACVSPGKSEEGESCPCAMGYVCSKATQTCLKVCHTTVSTTLDECEGRVCQGGTVGIPEGFGVCVGLRDW